MYIITGNNHAYALKDAELADQVLDFLSEIKFDVSGIEKTLGKIGFDFSRNIDDDTIVLWIIADHHCLKSAVLTFTEIKERFVSFAKSLLSKEINSANDLFQVFEKHFSECK